MEDALRSLSDPTGYSSVVYGTDLKSRRLVTSLEIQQLTQTRKFSRILICEKIEALCINLISGW